MERVKPRFELKFLAFYLIVLSNYVMGESSAFSRPLLEEGRSVTVGKDIKNLKKGEIFQHPSPSPSCLPLRACQKEALIRCLSKKAVIDSCSELYSGSWVTTCVCE